MRCTIALSADPELTCCCSAACTALDAVDDDSKISPLSPLALDAAMIACKASQFSKNHITLFMAQDCNAYNGGLKVASMVHSCKTCARQAQQALKFGLKKQAGMKRAATREFEKQHIIRIHLPCAGLLRGQHTGAPEVEVQLFLCIRRPNMKIFSMYQEGQSVHSDCIGIFE